MMRRIAPSFAVLALCAAAAHAAAPQDPNVFVASPNVTNAVPASNRDVNWIRCEGPVRDVITSVEKNVEVRYSGNNAFLKFKAIQKGSETLYSTLETEIYVICDDHVYKLLITPENRPATTILLRPPADEDVEAVRERFSAMPWETKLLTILKEVYTGEIPASYSVTAVEHASPVAFSATTQLALTRIVQVPGEGLAVYEYQLKNLSAQEVPYVKETSFLDPVRVPRPAQKLAIAVEHNRLAPRGATRVLIVGYADRPSRVRSARSWLEELAQ